MTPRSPARQAEFSPCDNPAAESLPGVIGFGRDICGSLPTALGREWLVTNGIGGFASGTIAGVQTRRYHGLLVAALAPPLGRTMLVANLDVTARYLGRDYALATHEYSGGVVDPHGYRLIESFRLEGTTPVWRYALADGILEQRIWMAHGSNTTYVQLCWERARSAVELDLAPLVAYRDYHAHNRGARPVTTSLVEGGIEVQAFDGAQPFRLMCENADFEADGTWHWNFRRAVESERGLDDVEDLCRVGAFKAVLAPGDSLTFVATTELGRLPEARFAIASEARRQHELLGGRLADRPQWVQQLAMAADQFIVRRGDSGRTVIAGYPWFGDWGRDTMIALPGLTLATGRLEIAAQILRTFARYVNEGMLPNRFPDGEVAPEYNTVDATLWYFHAVDRYLAAGGDEALGRELYPVLADIIEWHRRGTRYSIHVDPHDELLYAGEPGVQLTWMDAKVGDWVVTPRIGKPVEINALWHSALVVMAKLATRLKLGDDARGYSESAQRVATSFRKRFWFRDGSYLYDVIDGPGGTPGADGRNADVSLRPNQIFAVSLGRDLLTRRQQRAVVDVCARELFTPVGLRSLARGDAQYSGLYSGGPVERDGVYHQGTVWGWLLGPFATAHYAVYGNEAIAKSWLSGIANHLADAGLGTVSEIFDGDEPHTPRGCPAQAWSVSEALRAWLEIGAEAQIPIFGDLIK